LNAPAVTLLGDAIERPGNAEAMLRAARLFGVACRFRAPMPWAAEIGADAAALAGSLDDLCSRHARRIAFDNLPGARDVYGFRPGRDFAVMVGNERRGLSAACRAAATDAVQIPMLSRRINCLNVAAASAVALHYLCGPPLPDVRARSHPGSRRPELLLMGAGDHIELGSAIRSAAAFGWAHAFIDDREQAWFGVDRVQRSEGRAAARRGRNDIRVVPCPPDAAPGFAEVTIITSRRDAPPLHRADLARGPQQLLVVPDEDRVDIEREDWTRLGRQPRFARLAFPHADGPVPYRFVASIAMAEAARQLGARGPRPGPRAPEPLRYGLALDRPAPPDGEVVALEDLADY
jgi:hypothetical protein